MSAARNEPPDIDVDFEHERREEVIQYVYQKYGRDRAAIVATVTQLHYKGAVRDVGKAMGLSMDMLDLLSKARVDSGQGWIDGERFDEAGLNGADPLLRQVLALTRQLMGFPRQLGQHTGGFVITQEKLADLCPVLNARMEDRTNIEWNKDDIDALGIIKVGRAGAGYADLHPQGVCAGPRTLRTGAHAGQYPTGRPRRLRNDQPCGYDRCLPDRKPRTAGHATETTTPLFL